MSKLDNSDPKRIPIIEQLSPEELADANNLWGAVLLQGANLVNFLTAKSQSDLIKFNKWSQMSGVDRDLDPEFTSLRGMVHSNLKKMSEAVLELSLLLIAKAMRKELSSTSENRIEDFKGVVAGKLSVHAGQSADEILGDNLTGFLKEEGGHLADRAIEHGTQVLWHMAERFMMDQMLTEPAIRLVNTTYNELLEGFLAGYKVQQEKRTRTES